MDEAGSLSAVLEGEILAHEATAVLVSHDRSFVRNVGTRYLQIEGRRLVEVDGPEAFFANMAKEHERTTAC